MRLNLTTILALSDYDPSDIDAMLRGGMTWHEIAERLRARSGMTFSAAQVEQAWKDAA